MCGGEERATIGYNSTKYPIFASERQEEEEGRRDVIGSVGGPSGLAFCFSVGINTSLRGPPPAEAESRVAGLMRHHVIT